MRCQVVARDPQFPLAQLPALLAALHWPAGQFGPHSFAQSMQSGPLQIGIELLKLTGITFGIADTLALGVVGKSSGAGLAGGVAVAGACTGATGAGGKISDLLGCVVNQ